MGNYFGRGNVKPKERPVVPNHSVPAGVLHKHKAHPNYGYSSNRIKTNKYSILTFLPKNLFEQFHRFANLYFIFVVALNWVPEVNAFAKEIAALPVLFVLSVTAVKDAYEDFRRYRSDKKVNSLTCRVYSKYVLHWFLILFVCVHACKYSINEYFLWLGVWLATETITN